MASPLKGCPSCAARSGRFCGYDGLFSPASFREGDGPAARAQSVDRIALVAERHHGSTFLHEQLKEAFEEGNRRNPHAKEGPRETLGWVRHRHWFQPREVPSLYRDVNSTLNSTLVIVLFRNVYDWSHAMREGPPHAPYHEKRSSVEQLLTRKDAQWKPPAHVLAKWGAKEKTPTKPGKPCRGNFREGEISPCNPMPDDLFAIYEQDYPHGRPYASMLHMWAAKMHHFLGFGAFTPHLEFARMEDVLSSNTSVGEWLCHLRCKYALTFRCDNRSGVATKQAPPAPMEATCCSGGDAAAVAPAASWRREPKVGKAMREAKITPQDREAIHAIVPAELVGRMGYQRWE